MVASANLINKGSDTMSKDKKLERVWEAIVDLQEELEDIKKSRR